MAAVKRNEVERERDVLFLIQLYRAAGTEMNGISAAEILNDRRERDAREAAQTLGKPPEVVEREAKAARLSKTAVLRDIAIAKQRMRHAANVGTAVWLDDDIAEAQHAIAQLVDLNDQVLEDLERSRRQHWTRTNGKKIKGAKKDDKPMVEPQSMVTFRRDEVPGLAALYAVFIRNLETQAKLREEIRELRLGRRDLPVQEPKTFASALLAIDNPERARTYALELLTREVDSLCSMELQPIAPANVAVIRSERLRIQQQAERFRQLYGLAKLAGESTGERSGVVEIVVQRRTKRETSDA
jgi:hypothetical protein